MLKPKLLSVLSLLLVAAPLVHGKTIIVLDPGHGRLLGDDYRYHYQRPEINGLREDLLTLAISKYVRAQLVADKQAVVMTRTSIYAPYPHPCGHPKSDDTIPICNEDLKARVAIAKKYRSTKTGVVFVSIHTNGGKAVYLYGHTQALYCSAKSRTLALKLDVAIRKLTGDGPAYDPLKPGYPGLIKDCLGVLKGTAKNNIPGSILEVLHHNYKSDQKLLRDPNFLKKAGYVIAKAIEDFIY